MENKSPNTQIFRYPLTLILGALFLLYACSGTIQAQNTPFSSTNKKAVRYFQEAKIAYQKYQLESAVDFLNKSLEQDAAFAEAHALLGFIHVESRKYSAAKKNFADAIKANPTLNPNLYFYLAELELKFGEYQNAGTHFTQFKKSGSDKTELLSRTNKSLETIEFALKSMEKPKAFNPVNLGPGVNTELPEYFPVISVDNNQLLFTRQLDVPEMGRRQYNEDFFISNRDGEGNWLKAENIGAPINTELNEGAPSLSADGQLLIFTACELLGNYGKDRRGLGSCDLFYSAKEGSNWSKPANLGSTINSQHWETQPSFSADGRTLYFIRGIRKRDGSKKGDIYKSQLNAEGRWSEPEPLPANINTRGNESSVFIHPDGRTLYFSSDGHLGMGGLDIYLSKLDENGNWADPINLGYPINTHKSESSLLVSPDGSLAYFASDRPEGYGDLDLYSFELDPSIRPEKVTYFSGTIVDHATNKPLFARFELIDLNTEEVVVEAYSNSGDGKFLVTIPANRDYALNVSKDQYLFYSENFSLREKSDSEPYHKDIALHPIKVGEKIVLKNIFFETSSYALKGDSKVELQKLIEFLQNKPSMKIEISGHTDNKGSQEGNQALSTNRAKAVYNYLIENNISAERLSYKGYAATQPIADNATESGRSQNRRTEFKITAL